MEEESIIVDKAFKAAKSAGIKKLRFWTAESIAGLSEKRISRITGKKLATKFIMLDYVIIMLDYVVTLSF